MRKLLLSAIAVLMLSTILPAENRPMQRSYNVDYWVGNIKGGLSYPVGDSAIKTTPLYNFGISARKGLDLEFSVGGGITYAVLEQIPIEDVEDVGDFEATIIDAEAAWAPYVPDFFVWPYLKAGMGLYMLKFPKMGAGNVPEHASETAFGFLLGGGVNYPIGKMFAANIECLYNHVALSGGTGDVSTFFTIDAGLTVFLK